MASQACMFQWYSPSDPSEFDTDLTIWLNLIPICTELVDVLRLNLFFQLVLGTRFIQESSTVMTLVLQRLSVFT